MKRQMILDAFKWHDNKKQKERDQIIFFIEMYLFYLMIASQFILYYNYYNNNLKKIEY